MPKPEAIVALFDEFDKQVESHIIPPGHTVADTLMTIWPKGFPDQTVMVLTPERDVIGVETACDRVIADKEVWSVILRPQGPAFIAFLAAPLFPGLVSASGAALFTVGQAILTAVTFLVNFLLRPDLPTLSGSYEWDDDAPQFFSGQSNKFRPGSRVPDCLGTIKVWPDLIAEPWISYAGDTQTLSELYVVTNGTASVSDPRLSDETIEGVPITVYKPGENWPMDFPLFRTNAAVANVELPGPNETISYGAEITLNTAGTITANVDGYFTDFEIVRNSFIKIEGDSVVTTNKNLYRVGTIAPDGRTINVTPAPSVQQTITDGSLSMRVTSQAYTDGSGDLMEITDSFALPQGTLQKIVVTGPEYPVSPGFESGVIVNTGTGVEYPGGWTNYVDLQATEPGETVTARDCFFINSYAPVASMTFNYVRYNEQAYNPSNPGTGFTTQAFRVPGDMTTACEFDIAFTNGLYVQTAGGVPSTQTVEIEAHFREVGTDTWTTKLFTFAGFTRTPRIFTTRIVWADEGLTTTGEYEIYFNRVTLWTPDTGSGIVVDACQLNSLRGLQDNSLLADEVLTTTLVRLDLTTQNAQQASQNRNFNVMVNRWLPNWREGGSGELIQTNRVEDAILYTLISQGGYPRVDNQGNYLVDVEALADITQDLQAIGNGAANWNGIIDQTMTVEDQLAVLARPARITIYRRASAVNFVRLKAGLLPTTLINSRNKLSPETKTMNFSFGSEPDALVLRYMDQTDGYREASYQYPEGEMQPNMQEQSVIGVTNPKQIERSAQYLWESKIYERDTVEFPMTEDGLLLSPGQVIAVADHLAPAPPLDGEVTQIINAAAGHYALDRPVPEGTYIARLRDHSGTLVAQASVSLSGGETYEVTIPEWANPVVSSDQTQQVGLIYSFTPVDDADGELYYVLTARPTRDGPVSVTAHRYDDRAYAADST